MIKLEEKNPMSVADVLISIDGLPGYFTECSGFGWSIKRPMVSDPLAALQYEAASGTQENKPVTIARPFDPQSADDNLVYDFAQKQKCARSPFDFVIRPVTRCGKVTFRGTKALHLSRCLIRDFAFMDNLDVAGGKKRLSLRLSLVGL
ncbi:MAG: hypothetical protein HC878_00335 [Leptolyngbyaceae cyanobacterium SL_5_14]|nr:hypothetical protein [Leptolyngbyaceae cyanobacterium SL_5_14]